VRGVFKAARGTRHLDARAESQIQDLKHKIAKIRANNPHLL